MFAFIENSETTHSDSQVHSLSWMGHSVEEEGSPRSLHPNQGWLATGNSKGVVGITFTSSQADDPDEPIRTNFYLRGHRSEVRVLVKNT